MTLCPTDKCTGCASCVNACPHGFVSLVEDEYGEFKAKIDLSRCVDCGACRRACPVLVPPKLHASLATFVAWRKDEESRRLSASGGLATALSEAILADGGIVFATTFDKDLNPVVDCTDRPDDLVRFQGSKYVQSVVSADTFRRMEKILSSGRKLLFIGTPCQIAGFRAFLGEKKYPNLLTVDILCHGVVPTRHFREELEHISKGREIDNVRFRGNDAYDYHLSLWSRGKCVYDRKRDVQPYLFGFSKAVTLRENCYGCEYARPERPGDITLGDYLGLEPGLARELRSRAACHLSFVAASTPQGAALLESLSDSLVLEPRPLEERQAYPQSILRPAARPQKRDEYRSRLLRQGFVKAVRATLGPNMTRKRLTAPFVAIKRFLGISWRLFD